LSYSSSSEVAEA